jgi:pilus assembly protein Flp/PilA
VFARGCASGDATPAKGAFPVFSSYEYASAWLQARCRTDRGASLVEYALLVALIAVVCILAVTFLGRAASSKFSSIGSAISH